MKQKLTILVTGGAGFIGSHLTDRLLELGHHVVCIDNFDSFYSRDIKFRNIENALNSDRFSLLETDIRIREQLDVCFSKYKFDHVFHLAAKAGVRPSIVDPLPYYETNVLGLLNILEVMRKYEVRNMSFASSSSVYGNNSKVPFSESDVVDNPISPYAASKKAAELLCHTYHHLYNFDIFCFRFFTVYGPRQRPDLAIHKFAEMIMNEIPIPVFGDGSSSRDYTYIHDIVDGLLMSVEKIKGYEIINLGESLPIKLNVMIETLEKHIGKTAKKIPYPIQQGDVKTTFANISKARFMLNYFPKWSFDEGIKEFIEWKKN